MANKIVVYKAEREAGLTERIQANASIAYVVPIEPLQGDTPVAHQIYKAVAAEGKVKDFDLYYLKDILVTTGWNKNADVFDRIEVWAARHSPEHKPFNFEHRPLDIIGHITEAKAVDSDLKELDESLTVDELPSTYHIMNGSVLYRSSPDAERQALMEKTIAEIEAGEWFVSMECYFTGFDYGIEGPDGSHHVIARDEKSAWLTKYLRQYDGPGFYTDAASGKQYKIGRVLKNITFSGKGLVRKPANPDSIILNSVAAFMPTTTGLGYLTAGVDASSSITNNQAEVRNMPDANIEQELRQQLENSRADIRRLNEELATLKNKDTETVVAGLKSEVADRDEKIKNLNTQLEAAKDGVASLLKRAEAAEKTLAGVQDELKTIKATEQKRARLAVLTDKGLEDKAAAEKLVEKFSALDDAAFAETVDIISVGWKTATPPKKVDETKVIDKAKVETEPVLATAGENVNERESAEVEAVEKFLAGFFRTTRGLEPVAAK